MPHAGDAFGLVQAAVDLFELARLGQRDRRGRASAIEQGWQAPADIRRSPSGWPRRAFSGVAAARTASACIRMMRCGDSHDFPRRRGPAGSAGRRAISVRAQGRFPPVARCARTRPATAPASDEDARPRSACVSASSRLPEKQGDFAQEQGGQAVAGARIAHPRRRPAVPAPIRRSRRGPALQRQNSERQRCPSKTWCTKAGLVRTQSMNSRSKQLRPLGLHVRGQAQQGAGLADFAGQARPHAPDRGSAARSRRPCRTRRFVDAPGPRRATRGCDPTALSVPRRIEPAPFRRARLSRRSGRRPARHAGCRAAD